LKSQFQHALEVPQFRTALDYRRRLTFGIDKLDSILQLHLDDIIGIVGDTRYTNALVTRLMVRSLLPHRHGGFDAKKVMIIDADNSSNPYLALIFFNLGHQSDFGLPRDFRHGTLFVILYFSRKQTQSLSVDIETKVLNYLAERMHALYQIVKERPQLIRLMQIHPKLHTPMIFCLRSHMFFICGNEKC
jgi:hypothetical protein